MDRNAYDGSIVRRTDGDAGYGGQQKENQIGKYKSRGIDHAGNPDWFGRYRCRC
jgi:hypothetical protein